MGRIPIYALTALLASAACSSDSDSTQNNTTGGASDAGGAGSGGTDGTSGASGQASGGAAGGAAGASDASGRAAGGDAAGGHPTGGQGVGGSAAGGSAAGGSAAGGSATGGSAAGGSAAGGSAAGGSAAGGSAAGGSAAGGHASGGDAASGGAASGGKNGASGQSGGGQGGAAATFAPTCGDVAGLQAGSPWPTRGRGPSHNCPAGIVGSQTGNLSWSTQLPLGVHISSPAIGADGTIYITTGAYGAPLNGGAYALDPNGAIKWSFALDKGSWSSPTLAADGSIYFGTQAGTVYALTDEGDHASLKWTYDAGLLIEATPVVGPDGTIYLGYSTNDLSSGGVVALYPSGAKRWDADLGGAVAAAPALSAAGLLYAAVSAPVNTTPDKGIVALDASSGAIVHSAGLAQSLYIAPTIGADGTVYAPSFDEHKTRAFSPDLATIDWTIDADTLSSVSIAPDGSLRFTDSGKLQAYSSDSTPLWTLALSMTPSASEHSTPAIDSAGNAYVGSWDSHQPAAVFAVAPSGSKLWSSPTHAGVSSSPAIGADGTIYAADIQGWVYAFGP